jgi:hypothetical protein
MAPIAAAIKAWIVPNEGVFADQDGNSYGVHQ